MSNTKFIKVDVSERLPNDDKKYFVWTDNPNARHRENKAEYNMHLAFFDKSDIEFKSFYDVTHFLEEVPDRESELIEMLEECKILLKIGCDPSQVNFEKIESLIQSVKQPN